MIQRAISFSLPPPWRNKKFETPCIGAINFLVGPNASGKSRFATQLQAHLGDARILGTERLSGMEQGPGLRTVIGDHLRDGFPKNAFGSLKQAGIQGSGLDTIVLLSERTDLRIQVEATLSHLFDRKIVLEWDSGYLVAKASIGGTGESYRLDREECHGIKELLVLLTHLYNDERRFLIIDEPELNLHPQYQAFFMQEVRKVAGDPAGGGGRKVVFLVTHSPFILDFRSVEDVKSVISFDLSYSTPKHIFGLGTEATDRLATLVPRLNVHHKQLFFSDNPIFVEGILDSQIVAAMQEARGVSVAGAGSCIIDAGGCEEVNHYLELCLSFEKKAHFLYDLDSLFGGNLRACIKGDGSIRSFLAAAGVGSDFAKYCGELEKKLTGAIDCLVGIGQASGPLHDLIEFIGRLGPRSNWGPDAWRRARVAVLTAISRNRTDMALSLPEGRVDEIEGRLNQIVAALKQRNVLLLRGGTIERYLPAYTGDPYEPSESAKSRAVGAEIVEMAKPVTRQNLAERYGELYEAVCSLPGKISVDTDKVLREYLGQYIHDLQSALVTHPDWHQDQLQAYLGRTHEAIAKVFSIRNLVRVGVKEFSAEIRIAPMLGSSERVVPVSDQTNSGMGEFDIRSG